MKRFPDIFFRTLSTPIIFALVVLGLHFFLRGHNSPGGGFIAGLIIAVAGLLARMSGKRRLLNIAPLRLVPVGLVLAAVTGIVPMLAGFGFLKSAYGYLTWPLIGEFEWATAVLFDAAVFLVVVGVTLTIIDLLAEGEGPARIGHDRATTKRTED
ncbi:MAG: MnhB domain-containing protein [Trueperaceae bacterium]